MEAFKLDTSGFVKFPHMVRLDPERSSNSVCWSDLSPFAQGYVEALFDHVCGGDDAELAYRFCDKGFSDLSPEALARIIADCAEMRRLTGCPDTTEAGRPFWADRQARKPSVVQTEGRTDGIKLDVRSWPPLAPTLSDDGLIYFREQA